MAMLDYGAIVFKNGKCITKNMFTDMNEAVGWEDVGRVELDRAGNALNLKGKYFTYIGDKEHTIGFFKNMIVIVNNYNENDDDELIFSEKIFFNNYFTWSKWTKFIGDSVCIVKPHDKRDNFILNWTYKGDKYKVYFGYGIDIHSYHKYGIKNYYKIPKWLKNLGLFPL